MRLYTKTGDKGETSLFGGGRVSKAHARVNAYGTVDEANSTIGVAAAVAHWDIREELECIMSDLLDLGSELATPAEDRKASGELAKRLVTRVSDTRIEELEARIDEISAMLPPLETFVLPTGSDSASRLHVARTAVRRAEREVAALAASGELIREELLQYLNRLSDLLFAYARLSNHRAGKGDVAWRARK